MEKRRVRLRDEQTEIERERGRESTNRSEEKKKGKRKVERGKLRDEQKGEKEVKSLFAKRSVKMNNRK